MERLAAAEQDTDVPSALQRNLELHLPQLTALLPHLHATSTACGAGHGSALCAWEADGLLSRLL